MLIGEVRGAAGRGEPGRELPRRPCAGRLPGFFPAPLFAVLLLPALPFFFAPFLPGPSLPLPFFRAEPPSALAGIAAPALELPFFFLAPPDLDEDDLAEAGLALALAEAGRVLALLELAVLDPAAAGLRAAADEDGRAGAARRAAVPWAADIELAALVRALAAVVIALVAAFTDCIAVDSVRADVVALVAAAVILVAAEVTLVAADETVRAAAAGAGLADEARLVRRAVVEDDLAVVRPAERCEALVLSARVLAEPAGVRRAEARAVICAGTDFPPS